MSSTQYLTDATTRHQVFLQRYGGGQSKEAVMVLNQLRRNINARLMQEPTVFQRERLVAVLEDVEALSVEAFGVITNQSMYGAQQLAGSEAAFSVNLFNKASTVQTGFTLPADTTLIAAVMNRSMPVDVNSSVTVEEALKQFGKKKTAAISQIISDGVTLGDTTPQIAKNLDNVINNLNRRQLDTLARTITNHTASITRSVVYEENVDIIDGYQWIATLDSNTTLICGSRDKIVYKSGVGPMPPAHWGCRSTTIPAIKPKYDIGAGVPTTRASIKGPVSGKVSYGGWLKQQPKPFVDEALGLERSKLFRSGRLKIDKFVDPTGRVYTLAELERMNPFAFME